MEYQISKVLLILLITKKAILHLAHLNCFMVMNISMKKLVTIHLKFLQIHFFKQIHIKLKHYMIISLKQQILKRVILSMTYIVEQEQLEFMFHHLLKKYMELKSLKMLLKMQSLMQRKII